MNRRRFLAGLALAPFTTPPTPNRKACNMPTRLPYSDSRSITLDGTGTGSVTFNGPPSLTVRELSTIVVNCATATPRPTVKVYRSVIASNRLMVSSPVGNDDTLVADPGDVLQSGEPLIIVWTGGAAGATCFANVNGTDIRA